ncbi:MAG: glycosyltransferase family 2 protein [Planctomycetes bacterium]|jgi:glycosyltransferase involved in cell wall biosynthesis|nr:glycosyltransferase family 2 protein [Planctomycetota bacterium]
MADSIQTRTREPGTIISVVVRARNAASDLERCLAGLQRQVLPPGRELEIVVVDNDSTDATRAVAQRHGAAVVPISQAEFSWGRALNRGIARTHGDVVLLLSSDATPAQDLWLQRMVEPLAEPDVGIVYGRQLAYPDAPVDERVRLERTFGTQPITLDRQRHADNPSARGMLASNACAAIRRDLWQQHPYDEQTSGGEEGPFTCAALKQGFRCLYHPTARVYHSHRDGPWKLACREWEILHKNAVYTGARLKKRMLVRWWAALVKRRLLNCARVRAPLYYRLEGLLRLPVDVAACVIAGTLLFREKSRHQARVAFWR